MSPTSYLTAPSRFASITLCSTKVKSIKKSFDWDGHIFRSTEKNLKRKTSFFHYQMLSFGAISYSQILSTIFFICANFAHCSACVNEFPSSVEANPHCVERAKFLRGTDSRASSKRALISSYFSSSGCFEVNSPRTINTSFL